MIVFLLWIGLSLMIASFGDSRKIGFWGGFFACLLLSPVIGAIFIAASDKKEDIATKKRILNTQEIQSEALRVMLNESKQSKTSVSDELIKLNDLRSNNVITEEEFQKLKNKLLN